MSTSFSPDLKHDLEAAFQIFVPVLPPNMTCYLLETLCGPVLLGSTQKSRLKSAHVRAHW